MKSLDSLTIIARTTPIVHRIGRIAGIESTVLTVVGLSDVAGVGDRVNFYLADQLDGEVIQVSADWIKVLVDGSLDRLRIGDRVRYIGPFSLFPSEDWLGRVIDANGQPLDGLPLARGSIPVRQDRRPPKAVDRKPLGARLSTGYALFNTMLPIVRGQRLGLFSGSGVGKSSLMAAFACDVAADVIVIALVGERGREVNHFIKSVLGPKGLRRCVVVCATSDESALVRRQAAFTAMAVAEFFRDLGRQVLLIVDSITRLAEAHREITATTGETMSLRGFPTSMVSLLAGFTERAGPGKQLQGDITALLTVLVSGSDMEEPVADTLRGLLDGHVVLSREIAERGRFPAVDVLQSVSRSLPEAATETENKMVQDARQILSVYQASEIMVRSGLYQPGASPELDRAVVLQPDLEAFAATRETSIEASFKLLQECLEPAPAIGLDETSTD